MSSETLSLIVVSLFALMLGSFFNVLIWRLPRKVSLSTPGSHCPRCNQSVKWFDNIPVVSWVILRGKCRHCKANISVRYPLVELGTALFALVVWYKIGVDLFRSPPETVVPAIALAFALLLLIPVAEIDRNHQILPDKITLTILVLGVLAALAPGGITIRESLMGIASGAGISLLLILLGFLWFGKLALGFGDLKLLAGFGSFFGWKFPLETLYYGAVVALIIEIVRRFVFKKERDQIPFGIALSLVVAALFFVR